VSALSAAISFDKPTAPYAPVDLTTLPKNYPSEKRKSDKVINFEIAAKTYRIEGFSNAIKHDRKNALAWFNRGRAYLDAKNYPAAVEDFDEAIRLNKNDPRFINGRGVAYFY